MITRVLLDRDLALPWMDAALTASIQHSNPTEARNALKEALAGACLAPGVLKQTMTALTRMWITPPPESMGVIKWAQQYHAEFADSRPLHLGALLTTQPFFASLLAETGRILAAGALEIRTPELRRRMQGIWGSRLSVDVSAQRGVRTMRALGLLHGQPKSSTSLRSWLEVTPDLAAWLARGLLVARDADSIGTEHLKLAPELFCIRWPRSLPRSPAGLEQHVEGSGRTVLVLDSA